MLACLLACLLSLARLLVLSLSSFRLLCVVLFQLVLSMSRRSFGERQNDDDEGVRAEDEDDDS